MRTTTFILLATLTAFAIGCKKKPDASGGDSAPASQPKGGAAGDDLTSAQGVWGIEKVDAPPEARVPPADNLARFTGTIKGNLLTVSLPNQKGDGGRKEYVVLRLEPSASPKHLDAILSDETGTIEPTRLGVTHKSGKVETRETPRETFAGIYKLEGDILVVAMATEVGGTRPTEFKSAAGKPSGSPSERSGVIVLYLKKK
jgi:uncharacterized protein (TIGR03067 family)